MSRSTKKAKKTKPAKANPIAGVAERFTAGESLTTLFKEASSWFIGKKGKFRRAIIAALGGKTKYSEVSAANASTRVPFGGKRRERTPGQPAVTIDDTGVKILKHVKWAPMNKAIFEHTVQRYQEARRRLKDEKLPAMERAILDATRRELRPIVKADFAGCWTSEQLYDPITVRIKTDDGPADVRWRKLRATVYVSPKGNRYVTAKSNEKATLILKSGSGSLTRLRRYEGSLDERRQKQEAKEIARGQAALERKRTAKREKKLARKKKSTPSSRRAS